MTSCRFRQRRCWSPFRSRTRNTAGAPVQGNIGQPVGIALARGTRARSSCDALLHPALPVTTPMSFPSRWVTMTTPSTTTIPPIGPYICHPVRMGRIAVITRIKEHGPPPVARQTPDLRFGRRVLSFGHVHCTVLIPRNGGGRRESGGKSPKLITSRIFHQMAVDHVLLIRHQNAARGGAHGRQFREGQSMSGRHAANVTCHAWKRET